MSAERQPITTANYLFLVVVRDREGETVAGFHHVASALADARWAQKCGFQVRFECSTVQAQRELVHALREPL